VCRVGDVVLTQVSVEPVREIEKAVVHGDHEVRDQPGPWDWEGLKVTRLDLDDLSAA
jgi:hypothetical protein